MSYVSSGGCTLDRTAEAAIHARDRLLLKSITGFIPLSVSHMATLKFLVNINFDRTEFLTELTHF